MSNANTKINKNTEIYQSSENWQKSIALRKSMIKTLKERRVKLNNPDNMSMNKLTILLNSSNPKRKR